MSFQRKIMTTRISREEKKLLAKKNNLDSLAAAINALENIRANYYYKVNRNSKTKINELLAILKQVIHYVH